MDGNTSRQADEWETNGCTRGDEKNDRRTGRQTDGLAEKWMHGWMGGWAGGLTQADVRADETEGEAGRQADNWRRKLVDEHTWADKRHCGKDERTTGRAGGCAS